jgi:hypothetical protein
VRSALAIPTREAAPMKRAGRQSPPPSWFKRAALHAVALAWRYPLELGLAAALSGAAGMIAWNALALQTARHPAPLFATRNAPDVIPAPLPPNRPLAPEASFAPSPAPAPQPAVPAPNTPQRAARDAIADPARPAMAPMSVPRPAPSAVPLPAPRPMAQPTRETRRDPIAELIRSGDEPPIPPGYVGRPDPARFIEQGQRALDKLGYGPLHADGIMGSATRQAIERFERDRRLPVTGEFGARTSRELSSASGITIE